MTYEANSSRFSSAGNYARPLLSLDREVRFEIIHILLNSLSESSSAQSPKYDLRTCFRGSWGEDMSVDEYCKELRDGISEPKEVDAW